MSISFFLVPKPLFLHERDVYFGETNNCTFQFFYLFPNHYLLKKDRFGPFLSFWFLNRYLFKVIFLLLVKPTISLSSSISNFQTVISYRKRADTALTHGPPNPKYAYCCYKLSQCLAGMFVPVYRPVQTCLFLSVR